MRCNTLILVEENVFSDCRNVDSVQSESLSLGVSEASSRQWVRRLRMPDGRVCYVDGVVRPASNDVRNVVADDWRCLRLEHSILPRTLVVVDA